MNSAHKGKFIFILVLLMLCSFSFSQNIKVLGSIPGANTEKMYQLQVGAYRQTVNVNKAAGTLSRSGFTPMFEKTGDLVRVFVVAGAAEVRAVVDRLGRAGFKEIVIREYTGSSAGVKPVETVPVVTVPEKVPPVNITENIDEPVTDYPAEEKVDFWINDEADYGMTGELWIEIPPEDYKESDHDFMHAYGE